MAKYDLIGRASEIEELERLYSSAKSEFVAIYGRRRVGKSYLINEVYGDRMAFSTVGIYFKKEDRNETRYRQEQLSHFYESLLQYGMAPSTAEPTSWREAFRQLRQLLEGKRSKRKVVFIDELPWLAGPQPSELLAELGFFWNSWACNQKNIILVVCGSATSWMLDNVIREYGGLYSRLTMRIHLHPFTLGECEQYYQKKNFRLSRYEMVLAYMTLGGIPYYMDKLRNDKTLSENIDRIFMGNNEIKQEFEDVYVGLFSSSERYMDIVVELGRHRYGMTRNEVAASIKMASGGTLTTMLDNLEQSGIIANYSRYGGARKETVYQLVDFFSLFYLTHIRNGKSKGKGWGALQRSPQFFAWAGLTFEILVTRHLKQLQNALGIKTVTGCYTWKGTSADGKGAQIDLVMEWHGERTDYVCEIKFSENAYAITADYRQNLLDKLSAFAESGQHVKSHSIQLAMVTTMGVRRGVNTDCVNAEVTIDGLFDKG